MAHTNEVQVVVNEGWDERVVLRPRNQYFAGGRCSRTALSDGPHGRWLWKLKN